MRRSCGDAGADGALGAAQEVQRLRMERDILKSGGVLCQESK